MNISDVVFTDVDSVVHGDIMMKENTTFNDRVTVRGNINGFKISGKQGL